MFEEVNVESVEFHRTWSWSAWFSESKVSTLARRNNVKLTFVRQGNISEHVG